MSLTDLYTIFCDNDNTKLREKSFHLNIFHVMLGLSRKRLGVANRMERCQAKSHVTIFHITSSFHILILVNSDTYKRHSDNKHKIVELSQEVSLLFFSKIITYIRQDLLQ